jgi:serine/threonine protein kinase/WD40 repeat protein
MNKTTSTEMNGDSPFGQDNSAAEVVDDRVLDLLIRFDEALLSSSVNQASVLIDTVPNELTEIVHSNQQFLALLHEAARAAGSTMANRMPGQASGSLIEAPKSFGRFQVVRELGHGSQGVVFLAFDPALKRHVAVKVPRWDSLLRPENRRRFEREAEIVARLTHPNIIAVHDVEIDEPFFYIASDFCEGPTLSDWLKDNPATVTPDSAARLVETLARAVQYAHSRGIVHRDLKPGNVILTADAVATLETSPINNLDALTPKLTDFGLARMEDEAEATRTGVIIGTPAYMSPEQAEGRSNQIGPASDIYSLGTLLYELLTGQPPIVGSSDPDTLRKILTEDPQSPLQRNASIPRDLSAITMKCLEKNANRRYRTADEFADDLAHYLRREPVSARPPRTLELLGKWIRRRPAAAALIALVSVLALGIPFVTARTNARLRELLISAEKERSRAEANESAALDGIRQAEAQRYTADVRLGFNLLNAGDARLESHLHALENDVAHSNRKDRFEWQFLSRHSPRELMRVRAHNHCIYFIQASDDGKYLFTVSRDRKLMVWKTDDPSPIRTFEIARESTSPCLAAVTRDGACVAFPSGERQVQIASTLSGEIRATIQLDSEANAIAFSPTSDRVAIGVGHSLALFEVSTGKQVWKIDCEDRNPMSPMNGSTIASQLLRFSTDGSCLAIAGIATGHTFTAVLETNTARMIAPFNLSSPQYGKSACVSAESHDESIRSSEVERAAVVRLNNLSSIPNNSSAGFSIPLDYSIPQRKAIAADTLETATMSDLHTGNRIATWKNYTAAHITSCALIGDEPKAAIGLSDGTLIIWACNTPLFPENGDNAPPLLPLYASASDVSLAATVNIRNELLRLEGDTLKNLPQGLVLDRNYVSLALSPSGKRLAAIHSGGIEIRSMNDGRLTAEITTPVSDNHVPPIFAVNESLLAHVDHNGHAIDLREISDGPSNTSLPGRTSIVEMPAKVMCVTLSSDGQQLVVGCENNTICGVELPSGKLLEDKIECEGCPSSIGCSSSNVYLAVGFTNGQIQLIDRVSKKARWKRLPDELQRGEGVVLGISFSPDDKRLYSSCHDLVCQNAETGSPQWQIKGGVESFAVDPASSDLVMLQNYGSSKSSALRWSGDGRRVVRTSKWTASNFKSLAVMMPTGEVVACDEYISPFSSLPFDLDIRRWILGRGVYSDAAVSQLVIDQLKVFASGGEKESTWENPPQTLNPRCLLASAHHQPWLATAGRNGSVEIWDMTFREQRARLYVCNESEQLNERLDKMCAAGLPMAVNWLVEGEAITAMAFAPDDQRLIVAGQHGSVRCWSTRDWSLIGQIKLPDSVSFVAVSRRDGRISLGQPHSVVSWSGQEPDVDQTKERAIDGVPTCGVFTPDGSCLFIGCESRDIVALPAAANESAVVFAGHSQSVLGLALSPDGQTLASAGKDGQVKLWSVENLAELGTLGQHPGRCCAVAFSPDGRTLYSVGDCDEQGRGAFLVWRAE